MSNNSRQEQKNLPSDEPVGELEPVAHFHGAMPTGVTVSHQGRIFITFQSGATKSHLQSQKYVTEMRFHIQMKLQIKLTQMIQQRLLYQYNR